MFNNLIFILNILSTKFCLSNRKKLKTDEIKAVFNFKQSIKGNYFRIIYKSCQVSSVRLAVIISKKTVRSSVERNYCKRIVRELFRIRQYQFVSLNIVVQIKAKFERQHFSIVVNEFDLLLSKISQKLLLK